MVQEPNVLRTGARYFGGRAIAVGITEFGIESHGLNEANPALKHRGVRMAASAGIAAAFTWWDMREQRRGRTPKVVRAVYIIGTALNIAHDVRAIRRN
jgi:hypothetical protein